MSQTIEKSMYETYPFAKRALMEKKAVLKGKAYRKTLPLRNALIRFLHERFALAEQKLDFSKIKKFTADQMPQSGPYPWLDRADADQEIERRLADGHLTREQAERARFFKANGYVILEKFFDDQTLDQVWQAYERRVFAGEVPVETGQKESGDLFLGRCLDAHKWAPELKRLSRDPRLVEEAGRLLGVEAVPFQTIIGFAGSEQKEHSDSIHMTTYPLGYLNAAWIAFEDIHPDSGPLIYYPGSHRLPYVFSHQLGGNQEDKQYKSTRWYNDHYEPAIAQQLKEAGLKPVYLNAKKGDVLIWHANLIHGGSPRKNRFLSRKALVAHYFGKGAFCFGDRNEMMVDIWQG